MLITVTTIAQGLKICL